MNLEQLQQKRIELAGKIKALADKHTSWTSSDQREWDSLNQQYDSCKAEMDGLMADEPRRNRIGRDGGSIAAGPVNAEYFQRGHESSATQPTGRHVFQASDGRRIRSLAKCDSLAKMCRSDSEIDDAETFGRAVQAMATGNVGSLRGTEMNLLSTMQGGGQFTVPSMLSARIIDVARNASSVMAAGVEMISMDGENLQIAKVTADPTPAWVAEGGKIPASNPSFGAVTLQARKTALIAYMTTELSEDGVGVTDAVTNCIGQAIALAVDLAVLRGSGGPQMPLGIRHWPGVELTAINGGLLYDDLLDGLTPIEKANGAATGWIANPKEAGTLRKLKDGEGAYLSAHPDIAPLQRLISNQQAEGEITFGDFSQVIVGIRRNLRLEVFRTGTVKTGENSEINLLQNDSIAFRATLRMDSAVLRPDHFNVLTGIA